MTHPASFGDLLRSRRFTRWVRFFLDDCLPPVIREWRPLAHSIARRFHGRGFDLDFKQRAFAMSHAEFNQAYATLERGGARYRDSDTTPAQLEAIARAARGRVLDVGCGAGAIATQLKAAGCAVIGIDVTDRTVRATRDRAGCAVTVAGLPYLPFRTGAFDTVVCAHTLEHIPDLWQATRELRRVATRVIVVVPRQRYYRYTIDYHLHFFPSPAPLEYLLGGTARLIDGDWIVVADQR